MQSVNVSKSDLVGILTKNRKAHTDEYKKALLGYREEIRERSDGIMEASCKSDADIDTDHIKEMASKLYMLPEPEDHTDDYAQAIEMLDMSVDSSVPLSHREYKQYVRDEWDWSARLLASNTFYATKAGI